jgi:hypothetical protein
MTMKDRIEQSPCERWLDAADLAHGNPLSPDLAQHLVECETCCREWNDLQTVWEALSMDVDETEVPIGLKEEVMNAVFRDSGREPERLRTGRFARLRLTGIATACLIVGVLMGMFYHTQITAPSQKTAIVNEPMQLGQNWQLVSYDNGMPQASGTAAVLQRGASKKIVIEVSGLKPTAGSQTYQVWLIHDGDRFNCGTFQVDNQGKGMLVYDLYQPDLSIAAIGITLEPDAQGTKPRGKKVAGTPVIQN